VRRISEELNKEREGFRSYKLRAHSAIKQQDSPHRLSELQDIIPALQRFEQFKKKKKKEN
jgi:hypothetical protein